MCPPSSSAWPEVSVVVCSRRPASDVTHRDDVGATIGVAHEYLRVADPDGRLGICAAYNRGVARARGRVIVFVHEDVWFRSRDWGRVLLDLFDARPDVGLAGVAGYRRLDPAVWTWPGGHRQFLRGALVCDALDRSGEVMVTFDDGTGGDEVAVVDGLFLALRAGLFPAVRFDEGLFRGFHFYDLDICMQVAQTHRLVVTRDIRVKHQGRSTHGGTWSADAAFFERKWRHHLPADCSEIPFGSRRPATPNASASPGAAEGGRRESR